MGCLVRSVALIVLLMVAGCGATKQARTTTLAEATDAYAAGRYDAAHRAALETRAGATGDAASDASYVAGLSAYRLRNDSQAASHFEDAARSGRPTTRARAWAGLGLVRLQQDRPREAAECFEQAWPGLSGRDATRAAHYAAVAYDRSGNPDAADRWRSRRTHASTGSSPGRSVDAGHDRHDDHGADAGHAGFALQVGAFQEHARARRAADTADAIARRNGLTDARIVERSESGGAVLHVVQVGSFPTRSAAMQARRRVGHLEYIVAPLLR